MFRLSRGGAPRNARAPGGMEGLLRLELSGRWAFIEAESLDKPSKALSPVMCCHEKLKRTRAILVLSLRRHLNVPLLL